MRREPSQRALERFEKKYIPVPESGCWLWLGRLSSAGYARFADRTSHWISGHRYSYQLAKGAIPKGYEIDHLCRVRCCVNPAHLEAVTPEENNRRKGTTGQGLINAAKTHCIHGHPFNLFNTWIEKTGHRHCRTCRSEAKAKYWRAGYRIPSRRGPDRRAKLTKDQVLAIRSDVRLQRDIAREYGVTPTTISLIKSKKNWKHLDG